MSSTHGFADTLRGLATEIVDCRRCPRLAAHCEQIARQKRRSYREWEYWGRPVPACGEPAARLVIVGLAPGAHGANRTGRMFTGDSSGDTLFAALHAFGFASTPASISRSDGLRLSDCYITAAVRCAPPGNRPTPVEFAACQQYLEREILLLRQARLYLALGHGAFGALVKALRAVGFPLASRSASPRRCSKDDARFRHGALIPVAGGERWVLCSYHPSRQNTQTGRLTSRMFRGIFRRARGMLG